jgi:hypothetical protein
LTVFMGVSTSYSFADRPHDPHVGTVQVCPKALAPQDPPGPARKTRADMA